LVAETLHRHARSPRLKHCGVTEAGARAGDGGPTPSCQKSLPPQSFERG